MKISKLFHWLYAVLMFLPLVMFLPSCLYYSLNKYATNETTTQINYKYQSNEINTSDDLINGNIYEFNLINFLDEQENGNYIYINGCKVILLTDYNTDEINTNEITYFSTYYFDASHVENGMTINNDSVGFPFMEIEIDLTNIEHFTVYIIWNDLDLEYNLSYSLPYYSYFKYTDYNVIESVETNVQDTISNKLYNAWESIWNLPLFAWTKNSFVSAPFTYITGLFGLQATNSLNYVFTYFCSISICWLVFDLLMYVPNLAHRWLDKGAIE